MELKMEAMDTSESLLGGPTGSGMLTIPGLDQDILQLTGLAGHHTPVHSTNNNNTPVAIPSTSTTTAATAATSATAKPPALTFTETQNGIDVMHHMKKMRETERYCDVVIYVRGKRFVAHRNILAACSPYFSSVFKASRTVKECIVVKCDAPDVFQTFLNYIYTGTVTIERSNVGELLRLANHFLMGRLKGYCGEYLERLLDAGSSLAMKEIAEKFAMTDLAKTASNFVRNNLGDVINHEVIMDLPVKQLEKFVSSQEWTVPLDAAVKVMSRWVCHDLGTRERDFKYLLTYINWNSMDPRVIEDYIDQEPLYGSSERCFYYVLHSLALQGIRVQKYEQMYQALQQRFGQESDQTVGYGDNLLQMAFNSAMEGLQMPPEATVVLPSGSVVKVHGHKWCLTDSKTATKKQRSKLPLTVEQKRKKYLAALRKARTTKKWVVCSVKDFKRKTVQSDEIVADSSGDEECDPQQTPEGYRCHLCKFTSNKISKLERHLAVIHARDVNYRCYECDWTCKWNRDYFVHMKTHYDGPPFKCDLCTFSCQKIGSLIAHKISHQNLTPYSCNDCDYKCRSKANMASHVKTHNNEKPYKCSTCSRSFANRGTLEQHMATHNPDKIFSCTSCSFTTKYSNQLSTHIKKTHQTPVAPTPPVAPVPPPAPAQATPKKSNTAKAAAVNKVVNKTARPANKKNSQTAVTPKSTAPATTATNSSEMFPCTEAGCTYKTNKKSQLDSHMRGHNGVRPHVCSICSRGFLEKSHLVRHERIHYNERPFKCEECDYASTRRDKLKEHTSRHHGTNASAKSPYKPRPLKASSKGGGNKNPGGVVIAKKSKPKPARPNSTPNAAPRPTPIMQQQPQAVTNSNTITNSSSGQELEFLLPHNMTNDPTGVSPFINASAIDLHQLSAGGIVQLQAYEPGKQIAHSITSMPGLSNDLSRLGVKIEDLQNQGLISLQHGGRPIKLEELGVQGIPGHHGTMLIDASQLQQLQAAVAAGNSGPIPITLASTPASNQPNNNQSSQSNEFGLSTLLY